MLPHVFHKFSSFPFCPSISHHLTPSRARTRQASEWCATNLQPERLKPPNLLVEDLEKSGEVSALTDSPVLPGAPETLTVSYSHAWPWTQTLGKSNLRV